jgi:replicative DNA helicase
MAKKVDLQIQDAFRRYIDEPKQRIVAKGLIEDNKLFSQMNKLVVPNAFGELNVRLIMGEVKKYYDEKGKVPSYDVLESLMMVKAKSDIEMEEFKSLISNLKSEELLSNLHDFKEIAIKFFKQQETIKISNKMMKSIEEGYDDNKLRNLLDEAKEILVPTDNDLGSSPEDFMEEIFNDEDEEKVPTGYFELDAVLGGGLSKGNVGLLAAHTGAGKTTFSTAMAIQAAIQGYNVLQIVFEESEKDIVKKQYACLTKDYVSNMSKKRISENTKAEVRKWMPIVGPRIKVKRLQNQKSTWEDVENYIFNLIMVNNFKPDVIFIDYFDCLKHTTDMRLTQVQAATRCIKKIDDFAKTHKFAIWVMQQTNRQGAMSATKGDVEGNIQGAFAVQQTTAVNMFLTKSEEEKTTNKATLNIRKNRQGCLCAFESFYFNNGTLQIDMSIGTTSADVEQAIADFHVNKEKNWENVHSELQKHYVSSQTTVNQTETIEQIPVLPPESYIKTDTSQYRCENEFVNNDFYDSHIDEWPDTF